MDGGKASPRRGGRVELVCCVCGYGIVVAAPPAHCPMCGESRWRRIRRGPAGAP